MATDAAQTEQLIKNKARILMFQKGFLSATTQEIADEAGVNRALIHYYFRSREQLMDILLQETVQEKRERVRAVLSATTPFRVKVANYINTLVDYGLKYPYIDNFVIHETARNPEKTKTLCSRDRIKSSELLRQGLEEEIAAGKLAPISAEHFVINLVSLINYPLLAKGVLQTIHGMSDSAYKKFLTERKRVIYRTIFSEDMPAEAALEPTTTTQP